MIMRKHNEAIHNQCAIGHNVSEGIGMEALWGVHSTKSLPCQEWYSSTQPPPPPPPHSSSQYTLCDPLEDRQIVELVGFVLVVVAAPIVAVGCAAGP